MDDISRCQQKIANERALAAAAGSLEAAEFHQQLAKLYEIQLNVMTKTSSNNRQPANKAPRGGSDAEYEGQASISFGQRLALMA